MKKLNQNGFGFWELLLLILLILFLAFFGWWVWQQQQSSKQKEKSSNSTPANSQQAKATNQTEPKSTVTEKKYLEINELGVKFELTDAIGDAYYTLSKTDPASFAYISLTSLKATDECAADKTSVVAVGKYKKTDMNEQTGKTYADSVGTHGVVIGNYAYIMDQAQAYCSNNKTIQQQEDKLWPAFLSQAKTIQLL